MNKPLEIASNFVVITDQLAADTVPVTDDFYQKLGQTYGDFAGHSLISSHTFDKDWSTWEMHPGGDEFVLLTSGRAEMILAKEDGDESVHLTESGQYLIVPRGIWHTARVNASASMLFVTPGEGTENKEQPPRTAAPGL